MPILVGEQDHVVPREHRRAIADALTVARIDHEIVEYPRVGHGFFCERRDSYDRAAAEDSRERLAALLDVSRLSASSKR